jgi:hypothetical protein
MGPKEKEPCSSGAGVCPSEPKVGNANKKCMAFIKNTIENAIAGSIEECSSIGEFLEKIKSQFTGSSKMYATQLLKQLVK